MTNDQTALLKKACAMRAQHPSCFVRLEADLRIKRPDLDEFLLPVAVCSLLERVGLGEKEPLSETNPDLDRCEMNDCCLDVLWLR